MSFEAVDDGEVYEIRLVVTVQHTHGPQPEEEDVAAAVAGELAGSTVQVGAGRVLVDDAEVSRL